jgi:DNA-binding Xre family transcriptional regulator
MSPSMSDRVFGEWERTARWNPPSPGERRPAKRWDKKPRRKQGRPAQWKYAPTEGRWQNLFIKKCRETGYVHTTGNQAGQPNIYRLSVETGISRQALHRLVTGERAMGMDLLGKLCDAFHCQPNDFLKRVTKDLAVTPSTDLPQGIQDDDLPGDEYVKPSRL